MTWRHSFRSISARPLVRGSVLSILGNGVGRIGGLIVSIIIAVQYGANLRTDRFYIVFSVVTFFLALFQGTLELAFIPVYSDVRWKDPSEKGRFLGALLLNILLFTIGLGLLIDASAWYFLRFFWPNQSQDDLRLIASLVWEMSPLIVAAGVSAFFIALLNAEKCFMTAGLMPLLSSSGMILFVLLLRERLEIHALSLGLVFGALVQISVMIVLFRRKQFRIEWNLNHPNLLRVSRLASLQMVALLLASSIPVLDRVIVSYFLKEGSVTAIENASRLCQIPWSFATVGYMNVFFSWWSHKSSEGDLPYVNSSFEKLFLLSFLVFLPVSLLLFLDSQPIVRLIFGYGKYSEGAVLSTSNVFGYYCLGYWAFMLRSTLVRFYSARQSVSVVTQAALLEFSVHFLTVFLLIGLTDVKSIGIGTTMGYFTSFTYLFVHYLRSRETSWAKEGLIFQRLGKN